MTPIPEYRINMSVRVCVAADAAGVFAQSLPTARCTCPFRAPHRVNLRIGQDVYLLARILDTLRHTAVVDGETTTFNQQRRDTFNKYDRIIWQRAQQGDSEAFLLAPVSQR